MSSRLTRRWNDDDDEDFDSVFGLPTKKYARYSAPRHSEELKVMVRPSPQASECGPKQVDVMVRQTCKDLTDAAEDRLGRYATFPGGLQCVDYGFPEGFQGVLFYQRQELPYSRDVCPKDYGITPARGGKMCALSLKAFDENGNVVGLDGEYPATRERYSVDAEAFEVLDEAFQRDPFIGSASRGFAGDADAKDLAKDLALTATVVSDWFAWRRSRCGQVLDETSFHQQQAQAARDELEQLQDQHADQARQLQDARAELERQRRLNGLLQRDLQQQQRRM